MAPAASTGRQRYRWLLLLVAAVLLVAWLVGGGGQGDPEPAGTGGSTSTSTPVSSPTRDGDSTDPASGLPVVRLATLPPEAARTVELIEAGGPFPEPEHDGGTFGNREELLPDRPMGYYREYTVPTPGLDHRGARRIVAGEQDELYWTADHYSSFARIRR
ncbi:ribonuclease domain-containing protein [Nocardioides sp. zg-1230]|uniref:ribonuclease domain-containing protein n=1 Tax=Nocardioides sp. zg-1230 TaxID=2736601 RepID=UPI001555506E|nr:ribonuclease domain-containing protein [Nocardioides sp. zg-1230]NPC43578.1 ribonuclease [Nocardioides sp. zg-1230]